ncbi:hypothetical protein F5Y12DRAFT_779927 [Xylaria sp. FL1777]|nr:hypothetical protein F5Y12DRAFT_779927 [Xylaria sp. FL1777]
MGASSRAATRTLADRFSCLLTLPPVAQTPNGQLGLLLSQGSETHRRSRLIGHPAGIIIPGQVGLIEEPWGLGIWTRRRALRRGTFRRARQGKACMPLTASALVLPGRTRGLGWVPSHAMLPPWTQTGTNQLVFGLDGRRAWSFSSYGCFEADTDGDLYATQRHQWVVGTVGLLPGETVLVVWIRDSTSSCAQLAGGHILTQRRRDVQCMVESAPLGDICLKKQIL